jgi:hypothetical protein
MNKLLAMMALTLVSTLASAWDLDPHGSSGHQYLNPEPRVEGGPRRVDAPEIDPGSTMAALTLLGGGLLVLVGRFSRKPSREG